MSEMQNKESCKAASSDQRGFGLNRSVAARAVLAAAGAAAVIGVAVSFGAGFGGIGSADNASSAVIEQDAAPSAPAAPARGGPPDFGAMLVKGLQETEGCLGVDAGQFRSGKNTIVAWFENKEAAVRWYHSPVHRRMLGAVGADPAEGKPLEHVTDPNTPIMVMASISMDGPPIDPASPLPFSQISIELFAPLPGGASVNGRLAPKEFKVPHHKAIGG